MTKKSKIYAFGYNSFKQIHPESQDVIISSSIDITAFADKIIWANMNVTLGEKSINESTILLIWGFDSVENKIISPTLKSMQRVKKCFGNDYGIQGFLDIDGNIHLEGEHTKEINDFHIKIVDVSQFWTGNIIIIVTADGKLYAWNIEQASLEEITPTDDTTDNFFIKVACGENHCLALTQTGQVFSWGSGRYGQLGHGDTKSLDKPKVIEFFLGLRVSQIACGGWHSAVITDSGDLYTFGWNHLGRLGIPQPDKNDQTQPSINYAEPTLIELNEGKDFEPNVIKVSCGSAHTAIITDDYRLWTCGWGKYGQQGQGPDKLFDNYTFTPVLCSDFNKKIIDCFCGRWNTFFTIEELDNTVNV